MFDIDILAKAIDEKADRFVAFDKKKGEFVFDKSKFNGDSKAMPLYEEGKDAYIYAKRFFREDHIDLFPDPVSKYSRKRWKEVIDSNHLEEEWFKELRLSLARSVTDFCIYNSIHEKEADSETYRKIREMLERFEARKFEERYTNKVLFKLWTKYDGINMNLNDTEEEPHGLTFFPDDLDGESFYLLSNLDDLNVDSLAADISIHAITFDYEKGDPVYSLLDNPYGKDNRFSSTYLCKGTLMHSLLPSSIGIRALSYLEAAYRSLTAFDKTEESAKVREAKGYHEVTLLNESNLVEPVEDAFSRVSEDCLYSMFDTHFAKANYKITEKGAFDATIRVLKDAYIADFDPDRAVIFTLIAVICDHSTGKIVAIERGTTGSFYPFDEVASRLSAALNKLPAVPKTIYVNGFFDEIFYDCLFTYPYLKSRFKVKAIDAPLATDPAYEGLLLFLKEMDEENPDSKKHQS